MEQWHTSITPLLSVVVHGKDPRSSKWLVAAPRVKRETVPAGADRRSRDGSTRHIQQLAPSLGSVSCSIIPFTSTSLWPSPLTVRSPAKEHETGSGTHRQQLPEKERGPCSLLMPSPVRRGAGRAARRELWLPHSSVADQMSPGLPAFLVKPEWYQQVVLYSCTVRSHFILFP